MPNSLTVNLWDNTNSVAGLTSGSTCKDLNGRTMSSNPKGFQTASVIPFWGRNVSPALNFERGNPPDDLRRLFGIFPPA